MYAVRFVIREFDLNYYASTDLNQFYPSDFDLKMTIFYYLICDVSWKFDHFHFPTLVRCDLSRAVFHRALSSYYLVL